MSVQTFARWMGVALEAWRRCLDDKAYNNSREAIPERRVAEVRDELLAIEQFGTLLEAQFVVADWCGGTTATAPTRPWDADPVTFSSRWRVD